jgi:hypothetical protein
MLETTKDTINVIKLSNRLTHQLSDLPVLCIKLAHHKDASL